MNTSLLFHYTDINAMVSIIGNDFITLRATNVLYLNDPRELLEGIDAVLKVENVPLTDGQFRSYYLTSFSGNEDELNMWGMYAANGAGCALAFDYESISKAFEMVIRCTYGQEEIQKHYENFVHLNKNGCITTLGGPQPSKEQKEEIRKATFNNLLISTCLGSKNSAYKHEKETRGIVSCNDSRFIKYRTRNNYIVPFVEIRLPKTALRRIVVGPTSNSDLTIRSIYHMLQIKGYDYKNLDVVASKIPYRG